MSSTSVDFPLPETPVTQVRQPSGIAAVTFLRLFSVAPTIVSQPSEEWLLDRGATRWRGIAILGRPERKRPLASFSPPEFRLTFLARRFPRRADRRPGQDRECDRRRGSSLHRARPR